MLGRMLSHLEAGTALYMQALSGTDLDAILSSPRGESTKAFCAEAALRAAVDAVQIHGGYGYMQDYGVEKLMRDAKMLQLLEGSGPVLEIEAAGRRVEAVLG
jgi:alkylation response protein AidB-like acyl-CoA dehydrogenase